MTVNDIGSVLLIGIGATLFTDLWCVVRRRLFAVPFPNYGFVGRWAAHLVRGRFRHDSIAAVPPVRGESAIGWSVHYLVGIAFAFLLPAIWGTDWLRQPTLDAALLVGVSTVVVPFLVMQPAMGAGIAASRTSNPPAARVHSVVMHAAFGLGLYVAARLLSSLLDRG